MDPINYSIDVQTPFQAALQGYQAGAAIRNDQLQQQQLQQALAQQEQLKKAYAEVAANPTADGYSRLMLLDPKASEGIKRAWDVKNTEQQQAQTADLLRWGAAIKSGQPQIAADQLTQRADALERQNNGQPTPESQALRVQAKLATDHPDFALGQIQALLAANPNGKDAAETLAKFGQEQRAQELQPALVQQGVAQAAKAGSEAATAAVTAKYAEPAAIKDLETKGWNIENIKSEIGWRKEQGRLEAMKVALGRADTDLKRQELQLKIQAQTQDMADKARAKVSDVETARSSIDNMLNTADRVLQHPGLDKATGSLASRLPSLRQDSADFESLVESLGSQAFLAQVPSMKGLGALSNAEGEKLQSALQSLSLRQSGDQFRANVKEAQRLMLKARENISKRYGVPVNTPDTPDVKTPAADIDALVKKYTGGG